MEHFVTRFYDHIEDIFRELKLYAYRLALQLSSFPCFSVFFLHDFTNFLSVSLAFVYLRISMPHLENNLIARNVAKSLLNIHNIIVIDCMYKAGVSFRGNS